MRDDAFEASGRALSAALRRSSCSGTEQHPRQARLRTAAARETAATAVLRSSQGAIAIDLDENSLGEISLGEKSLGEIDLGEINVGEINLGEINLGDNRHGRLECKIMLLGEVSPQETTATTLEAMP